MHARDKVDKPLDAKQDGFVWRDKRRKKMKFSWVLCAVLLFSSPAFADGKGQKGDEHSGKEMSAKAKSKSKDKDKDKDKNKDKDKDKDKDDQESGEGGRLVQERGKSGDKEGQGRGKAYQERGDSDGEYGGSGEGEDGDPNEAPGIDSGEAPRDTLTQQKNEAEKHLRRMAKIQRLEALGSEQSGEKLKERAKVLREKEMKRHEKAVRRLETKALE